MTISTLYPLVPRVLLSCFGALLILTAACDSDRASIPGPDNSTSSPTAIAPPMGIDDQENEEPAMVGADPMDGASADGVTDIGAGPSSPAIPGELGEPGEPGEPGEGDDGGTPAVPGKKGDPLTGDCDTLLADPSVNWRQSSLQTDQEIVACLAGSLGRPVGYGENAMGGYDPDGASTLTIIRKDGAVSIEQQLADAVAGEGHNWIVFDKDDFAQPTDVALYRIHCMAAAVQAALGVSGSELCLDHTAWCGANGVADRDCADSFFNDRLNDKDLPIRNVRIGSNTTIDGRQSQAQLLFSGFAIGSDSGGEPVETASSVIVTNLRFQGAGHTEDHGLDPDMLRLTGASYDIWIHQNTFDLTGDAAFDVKVGAYDITISFNRVQNVKRAALHGSSDSREINAQIATTFHHNAFITTDDFYDAFGNTGRRVPLIRRGKSHFFNNVFYGYRKDVLSVRVGARVAIEDSLFLANPDAIGDDDQSYFVEELLGDFREGGLEVSGSYVALADESYQVLSAPGADLSASHGSTPDMLSDYGQASRDVIATHRSAADQSLVDYVIATAGKDGATPFNAAP